MFSFYFYFLRKFLEHASEVSSNHTSDEVDSDNSLQMTKIDPPFYNQINITIPSSSPEMNSLSPKKQEDELALNNRQNLLAEIRNCTVKPKVSNSSLSIITSGPCSPKNSSQIICPQTLSSTGIAMQKKLIPYTYNNNHIVNDLNIPDNLSFANKQNNENNEDVTTNKNNQDHLFGGKQPVCCVCNMRITR